MNALLANSVARSIIWRLGRKLYTSARRDFPQEPSLNGEYWLLEQITQGSSFLKLIFIDICHDQPLNNSWTCSYCL